MDRLPNALRGDEPHNAYRPPAGLFGQNIRVHLMSDVEVNPARGRLLRVVVVLADPSHIVAALAAHTYGVRDWWP
jgi:hypothetical protein